MLILFYLILNNFGVCFLKATARVQGRPCWIICLTVSLLMVNFCCESSIGLCRFQRCYKSVVSYLRKRNRRKIWCPLNVLN